MVSYSPVYPVSPRHGERSLGKAALPGELSGCRTPGSVDGTGRNQHNRTALYEQTGASLPSPHTELGHYTPKRQHVAPSALPSHTPALGFLRGPGLLGSSPFSQPRWC